MNACFDDGCHAPATRELNGFPMCTRHYIEALEHSAHIVCRPVGLLLRETARREELALGRLQDVLIDRVEKRKRMEERTGHAEEFSAIPPGEVSSPGDLHAARPPSGKVFSSQPAAQPEPEPSR